jgi:hypothetical protein
LYVKEILSINRLKKSYKDKHFFLNDFWEYDSASDTWTERADFVTARGGSFGFSIGLNGYVVTGIDAEDSTNF